MKKIAGFFLLFALCGIFNSSSAQLSLNLPESGILDEPIGIDLTLKSTKLPNGVNLQYAEQGTFTGTPVIFLHGITDSWHSFESVLRLLPSTIHAYAISQRGHGDSDRPVDGYSPKDFAADIAAFITLHDLKQAFIVGHSMGSIVAQQFALDYPHLTKGIILIGSSAAFKDNPGMPEFYSQVMTMNDPMDKTFMDEFQKGTLAKPIDPGYYDLLVSEGMKVPVWVFKAAMTGLMSVDYSAQLKRINVPVLILWGTKDNFCFRDDQEQLVKEIRDARLFAYEGTGHALHWEEPARFAKDLVGFVTRSTRLKM